MAHILFVTQSLNKGGSEKQLASVAAKAQERGHRSTVIALSEGGWWSSFLQQHEVPVSILKFNTRRRLLYVLWHFIQLRSVIKSHHPDIIVAFLYEPSILAGIAARFARVPFFVSSRRDCGFQRDARPFPQFIEQICHHVTYRYIANSAAVKRSLSDREMVPADKVEVIYNGIDIPSFTACERNSAFRMRLHIPSDAVVVGMIANFWPHKNHLMLIRSAEQVVERLNNVYFVLAGRPSDHQKQLEQEIEKRHLKDHFVISGSMNDVSDLLSSLDIGVVCSETEGFSNTILEYMVYQIPVIATAVGGNPEAVIHGKTGYLVPLNDISAMSRAIIDLAENPDKRSAMGSEGRYHVEQRHTWDIAMKQWIDLFDGISRHLGQGL